VSERDIFTAAREMTDPAARSAYLDGACGGDPGLRSRVEALLRAHDQADSLLDHPAVAPPDPDAGATQALTGTPDPGVAAGQTTGGETGASEEPLTFLAPGTRPDSLGRIGHYEVLQVLGRGGFGIVFRAFDEILQRVVALKVMAPQLAATSPARKRFLREARSSAQVRHENVVQVYEVAEQPLPYLAMEFIPGETLQQRLDRIGPVEPAEVVRLGRQIAEGLAAAHATDLVHRDIKPGNILLEGGQQKVKLTDFGLARAADDASLSQSGIIAGTPMYMAPEQAKGETLDQRADLFSLGSVLYQMAAGRPPFRANSAVAVLKRVAEDTPRPIREIIPETPQWLCDIIARLHAKNPDDRYQSAREVADVLADCEAQLKAHARLKDYSRIPRSKGRPAGRRKWVAAAALLLLPILALAVTESSGVTHLFRAKPVTTEPIKPEPIKPDGDPTPLVKQETPPPRSRTASAWSSCSCRRAGRGWAGTVLYWAKTRC
jgi:serine/threonine protein kinase